MMFIIAHNFSVINIYKIRGSKLKARGKNIFSCASDFLETLSWRTKKQVFRLAFSLTHIDEKDILLLTLKPYPNGTIPVSLSTKKII